MATTMSAFWHLRRGVPKSSEACGDHRSQITDHGSQISDLRSQMTDLSCQLLVC